MSDKPNPRVDETGVPWCRRACASYTAWPERHNQCGTRTVADEVCSIAVRAMAQELREAREQANKDSRCREALEKILDHSRFEPSPFDGRPPPSNADEYADRILDRPVSSDDRRMRFDAAMKEVPNA